MRVEKIYWSLVEGIPKKEKGTLESYIGNVDIWKPNINRRLTGHKKSRQKSGNKKKALSLHINF